MGSPAYWGKLTNFTAASRKANLIPFGYFSPNDNIGFISSDNSSAGNYGATYVNVVTGNGAKGDGVTDDSNAINSALAAVGAIGGGTVYFPGSAGVTPAVYGVKFHTLVVQGNNTIMRGDGMTQSTIKMLNASTVYTTVFIGTHSDFTAIDLGFFGNFANNSYPVTTLNTCLDASDSTRFTAIRCKFRGYGFSSPADAAYTQVISLYRTVDFQVRNCEFYSNLAYEININGANGGAITDNTFGTASIAESRTNIDWWDSNAAGFGTLCIGSNKIYYAGNRAFGGARALLAGTPVAFTYLISDGGGLVQGSSGKIQNNEYHGLGNCQGTVSVLSGSGGIVGSHTVFWSGDVGRSFMVDGDTTIYTVTGFTSATSITVSPNIVRSTAFNLRYQYQNSGDLISFAPANGLTITGNTIEYSGDNGIDLIADAGQNTQHVIVSDNRVLYSQVAGLYLGGAMFNIVVDNNQFVDNCRKSLAGHMGAIELSPTDQGASAAQPMWHMSFTNNQFQDDQATTTQLYAFQIDQAQVAHIFSNTLGINRQHTASSTNAMFNPEITPTMIGQMFNYVSATSPMEFTSVAFADLANILPGAPIPDGTTLYCFDAKNIVDDAAVAGAVAVGGGNGCIVKRQNGKWIAN